MKKLITWSLVLVLCISLIPAFIAVVKATPSIWYVATTGSDAAAGDIAHPFKTIQKGVDVAVAGDTVYVRGGTYSEHVTITKSGTAGNPITLTNYGSEVVTLDGTGVSLSDYGSLINIGSTSTYPAYIIIQNLNIRDSSQCGLGTYWITGSSSPCHDITVQYCTFTNMELDAVFFMNENGAAMNNINVNHCTMTNIQYRSPSSNGEGNTICPVSNSQFSYNTIRQCYQICCGASGTSTNVIFDHNDVETSYMRANCVGIYVDGGQHDGQHCDDIIVSNNYVSGTGQLMGFCNEIGASTTLNRITFVNNVLHVKSGGAGIVSFVNTVANHYYDITLKHNTIYTESGASDAIILSDITNTYMHNLIIANNIIYRVGSTRMLDSIVSAATVTNNLYYSTAGTPTSIGLPLGTNYKVGDPLFVSTGTDFYLQSSSPAINAGSTTYTWPTDIDGKTRGSPPDIGAYEYNGGASSGDSTAPVISQVGVATSSPIDTLYGWENFTCVVTDNVGVSIVLLKFTNPDQSTTDVPMIKKTGTTTYYANQSLHQAGNYSYRIQATDTNNNVAFSSSYTFSLPPNWDINNDGVVSIVDLVLVSDHYGETGRPGWIREDVDNNGIIQALDIVLVSSNFGASWWK